MESHIFFLSLELSMKVLKIEAKFIASVHLKIRNIDQNANLVAYGKCFNDLVFFSNKNSINTISFVSCTFSRFIFTYCLLSCIILPLLVLLK